MENKSIKTVEKYNMLSAGDTVVIGVSGGADSCALFHFLLSLREKMDLHLICCHVNHMLRGKDADSDEEFVRELCRKNGVEFRLLKTDVAKASSESKTSTEQCGRDIRYRFFEKTAAEYGAKIATAHTASDNAETVIFNMTRGCGVNGLCGIPPVRGNIIRPLIEVTRSEIEAYCESNGISFVTDATNLTNEYTRNKIRHDVIPVLSAINPSFEQTILKMSDRMRSNADHLKKTAESILKSAADEKGYRTEILKNCDEAVFAEIAAILAQKFDIVPDAVQTELIRKICTEGGAVELKSKIFAVSKQGFLRIIKQSEKKQSSPVKFDGQEIVVINDKKIRVSVLNIDEFNNGKKNNNFLFHNALDYDTIPLSVFFRTRQSGDNFRLRGRKVTKTLKKLFIEMKIPMEQRNDIVILAHDSQVVWIEGIGAAESYGIKAGTKKVLLILPENKEGDELNA